jgi:hypothetical protein
MRRRRKQQPAEEPAVQAAPTPDSSEDTDGATATDDRRAHGPWDVSERPVADDEADRIDLGSLLLHGGDPEVEVRLQVDEKSEQVIAVMLVSQDGAIELRPFAAPRHEDSWEEVRPRIAADAARRGGTATTVEGPYGPALQMVLTGTDQEGRTVTQQSVVWGINGPRWLLRAHDYQEDGSLERALREVVVVRGTQPMAPGDALPLKLPTNARRTSG